MTDHSYFSINPLPIDGDDSDGGGDTDDLGWEQIAFSVDASIDVACQTADLFATLIDESDGGPDVVEHKDIVPFPGGGHSCTKVFRRGSKLVSQRNTMVELVPNERFVARTSNPNGRCIQTFVVIPALDGTRLTIRMDVVRGQTRVWGKRRAERKYLRVIEAQLARIKATAEHA